MKHTFSPTPRFFVLSKWKDGDAFHRSEGDKGRYGDRGGGKLGEQVLQEGGEPGILFWAHEG